MYAEAMYGRYHYAWSELYALTDARFRFIRAPRDELYDIQSDPGERQSVAGEREQTRVAMRQALDRLLAGTKLDSPGAVTAEDRERLKALGYVGMQPTVDSAAGSTSLPDPKDKVHVLAQYRNGLDLVRKGELEPAIAAFQAIVSENPGLADAWGELAGLLVRQRRLAEAVTAYKHLVEAAPHDPAAIVSVAQVLVESGRLDEAGEQAELALKMLPAGEQRWRATACKTLMRIALDRNDLVTARAEAARGQREDPSMPLPEYVEGLIRFNAGQYADALPYFEAALKHTETRTFQIPDLRYYLGDTLGRLERYAEAERQFNEEVRLFPSSLRARAGLAMLYRVQGRNVDAERAINSILRVSPTSDGFALALKLWTMFGENGKAAAVKADARQRGVTIPPAQRR
jgi:tetratricopeptide (TPR) repeat protein